MFTCTEAVFHLHCLPWWKPRCNKTARTELLLDEGWKGPALNRTGQQHEATLLGIKLKGEIEKQVGSTRSIHFLSLSPCTDQTNHLGVICPTGYCVYLHLVYRQTFTLQWQPASSCLYWSCPAGRQEGIWQVDTAGPPPSCWSLQALPPGKSVIPAGCAAPHWQHLQNPI